MASKSKEMALTKIGQVDVEAQKVGTAAEEAAEEAAAAAFDEIEPPVDLATKEQIETSSQQLLDILLLPDLLHHRGRPRGRIRH